MLEFHYIHDFFQPYHFVFLEFGFVLLPSKKTTIAPENGWLEDEFPFLLEDFQVLSHVSFVERIVHRPVKFTYRFAGIQALREGKEKLEKKT